MSTENKRPASIREMLEELMLVPGLSGHEGRVRRAIAARLRSFGIASSVDVLGNLIATIDGDPDTIGVMLFTHMDQLGFIVRKIEDDGFIRVERLGGVPERALPSQAVLLCVGEGRDREGVIANKSHHATTPDEKYKVVPYQDLYIDAGFSSRAEVLAAGIDIGTPVVYRPQIIDLGATRVAGTAIDDRAGCAVLLEVARRLQSGGRRPRVHIVFSVQEEFNLRGALTAAQAIQPAVAVQIDLLLATDTPDMKARGDVELGGGPGISLYSFHGRGTLNGTIPHPRMVKLFEDSSAALHMPLQRSAHTGALTDSSYVQLVGKGVGVIDVGFPMRYSHSSLEVCDMRDLEQLADLMEHATRSIDAGFRLVRDDYP